MGAPTRTRRLSIEISWLLLATPRRGVGHFIFVISNSSNSSQINFIGLIGPQYGAVKEEEPIKHSDVLVEDPEVEKAEETVVEPVEAVPKSRRKVGEVIERVEESVVEPVEAVPDKAVQKRLE